MFILILAVLTGGFGLYSLNTNPQQVLPKKITAPARSTEISARVGGYIIGIISGWTSPFAEVTLTSQGVARKTIAEEDGFFAFYSVPIPQSPTELCFVAQDVNQLPTYPICLPPPPQNTDLEITDVFLPPTLQLEKGKIVAGGTTKASGMAFPGAEMEVFLFTEKSFDLWLRITRSLFAYSLPKYKIIANENGYYEFSLPANAPSGNRIFATAKKPCLGENCQESSPKSNTLFFQTLGLLGIIKLFLANFLYQTLAFFNRARSDQLWIILFEIIILAGLIILLLLTPVKKENRQTRN
jgi:hypothetical protein